MKLKWIVSKQKYEFSEKCPFCGNVVIDWFLVNKHWRGKVNTEKLKKEIKFAVENNTQLEIHPADVDCEGPLHQNSFICGKHKCVSD